MNSVPMEQKNQNKNWLIFWDGNLLSEGETLNGDGFKLLLIFLPRGDKR